MARPLPLLLAIVAGFAAASACYSDRQPPPTFRYSCSSNADCNDDEACMGGLCQVQCTQDNFGDVCLGANHLACFNGVCSTGCQPAEDDPCPTSQECIELGLTVAGGGFIGGGTQTMLGICGTLCTENSCPTGEECVFGLCAVPCMGSEDCPDGFGCTMGYCVPGEGDTEGSDGSGDDAPSTDDTTAADSTATTGGAT
jgi:hypothetical protein